LLLFFFVNSNVTNVPELFNMMNIFGVFHALNYFPYTITTLKYLASIFVWLLPLLK